MASDKMLGSFDQKSAPEDNDLLVEYDAAASKVKNVKFGGVWNWIVKKLTSAVINELTTSNKNVVGAINELNSNLQAKTKNISQQESDDIESLINLIISYIRWQNNGIFNICGSWKNHPKGYSAIVQKIVYEDKLSIKISGIIFSLDGNGWNFTSHITNDETITKIFFFAMS